MNRAFVLSTEHPLFGDMYRRYTPAAGKLKVLTKYSDSIPEIKPLPFTVGLFSSSHVKPKDPLTWNEI
ncbi:MAG: hypothetical protein ABI325_07150 [Ginsengibacter sp.]